MQRRRGGNRQSELFRRSIRPVIALDENHRLVQLTERLDWTELEAIVESIRREKLQSAAGRPPHLRALIGAVVFRATRHMTYRETEDQIRHYAPARYLCALTETEWTPDANTIQDFEELLGEDGIKRLNEFAVKEAATEGLADPRVIVADTTAQEAAIPYPNEMGLMATFVSTVSAASQKAGAALKDFAKRAAPLFAEAKRKVREYRLFAQRKTKQIKNQMVARMANLVEKVQVGLGKAIRQSEAAKQKLVRYAKVASAKAMRLHRTMEKLLPQIRYWLKTGYVAANKIINLQIPELYSVVRGKVGKPVEFGLSWGITRLKGGFLLATMAQDRRELLDSKFALRAVNDHATLFGRVPRAFAYDRGGHSRDNVAALRQAGVRHIGLAPRGRCQWEVEGSVKRRTDVGASAGRGRHWGHQVQPLRIPSTKGPLRRDDGRQWPARSARIQSQQAGPRIGEARGTRTRWVDTWSATEGAGAAAGAASAWPGEPAVSAI